MFRLSDYDFENNEKDYVAFMAVFEKFLEMCHITSEPKHFYTEYELHENAKGFALDYVEMRTTGNIPQSLIEFLTVCGEYLDYNINMHHLTEVAEVDDMYWNVYNDLV